MKTYFIHGDNGDDKADGLSFKTAWKTTKNVHRVRPGDTIYINGKIESDWKGLPNGEPGKPITIDGNYPPQRKKRLVFHNRYLVFRNLIFRNQGIS